MHQDINAPPIGSGTAQPPSEPFALPRSHYWPHVKNAHLAKHPVCEACLVRGDGLPQVVPQVHHIIPFQYCVSWQAGTGALPQQLDHVVRGASDS